jgi:hypothetical protein
MTTGKQRSRLSEKLNADLEEVRADHRDSITSQLKSFRKDLDTALSDALTTIDCATVQLNTTMDRAISRQQETMSYMREKAWVTTLKGSALAAILILLTLIVTSFLETRTSFKRLGIKAVEEQQATYLLLTGPNTRVRSCRVGGELINCIRIGKD